MRNRSHPLIKLTGIEPKILFQHSDSGIVAERENRNAFLRGGNWNNETNAGVFALNLNNSPTNTNNNIGFRCASDQQSAGME